MDPRAVDGDDFSVSQNDVGNPCQCPDCCAIDEAEGSHARSLLVFVNCVAAAIEPEFPGDTIDTLAHEHSRRSPRTIRPRHNVIAPLRHRMMHRASAGQLRRCVEPFVHGGLRGYSRLIARLYVWDYTTDFAHYLLPFRNLGVLSANVRALAANGVVGVFAQGNYSPGGGSEWAELRAWVLTKLLWYAKLEGTELGREFAHEVYGPGAGPAQRYFDGTGGRAPPNHLHGGDDSGRGPPVHPVSPGCGGPAGPRRARMEGERPALGGIL